MNFTRSHSEAVDVALNDAIKKINNLNEFVASLLFQKGLLKLASFSDDEFIHLNDIYEKFNGRVKVDNSTIKFANEGVSYYVDIIAKKGSTIKCEISAAMYDDGNAYEIFIPNVSTCDVIAICTRMHSFLEEQLTNPILRVGETVYKYTINSVRAHR